eukprot:gnl/TRDRNA2_/TRDRNA2_182328_c0_seq1.p1 gnl/TRDRNA2_/TRDRNA2_182328_c0~~gnl/TRDRNA2_/TRDRNA2_182328_c0_seq1.p1  ORF type:complete len:246 (-),score=34.89 gnl/TRDRNA2_/TRDRNA2_182328_c0_seq1:109-846(-)
MASNGKYCLVAAGPPLDYSFKELRSVAELETEDPRSGGAQKLQSQPQATRTADGANAAEETAGPSPTQELSRTNGASGATKERTLKPKRISVKYVTTSVKLNNNHLETVVGLGQMLEFAMPNPLLSLEWIDLSFNQLVTIEPALLRFVNLRALYLHGNCISSLPATERLNKLPKLMSLTLNGNPIENSKIYRSYVIGSVHGLRTLDHTTITEDERSNANGWFAAHLDRAKIRQERLADMALASGD